MKKISRAKRFDEALNKLSQAFAEFSDLKDEYQEWRDTIPQNLEGSATAEKLDEVLECSAFDDIENAQSELEAIELPKGFGRD